MPNAVCEIKRIYDSIRARITSEKAQNSALSNDITRKVVAVELGEIVLDCSSEILALPSERVLHRLDTSNALNELIFRMRHIITAFYLFHPGERSFHG